MLNWAYICEICGDKANTDVTKTADIQKPIQLKKQRTLMKIQMMKMSKSQSWKLSEL